MPIRPEPLVAELFDNPTLSDVKVRLIRDGQQVREWHAHKAVLCLESEFFKEAFTGRFKEANDTVIEVHDDNPEYFELMLKYIYNGYYKVEIKSNQVSVLLPIGLWIVADKYGVSTLSDSSVNYAMEILAEAKEEADNYTTLETVIHNFYGHTLAVGTFMGSSIASILVDSYWNYIETKRFDDMIHTYSTFGADMTLEIKHGGNIKSEEARCGICMALR